MRDTYIPQYLDEPERYLLFTPDELMAVVMPLAILTLLVNFLAGLAVAAFAFWALRKFKQGGALHRVVWRAYWILPSELFRLKATPPSHLRCLAG